MPTSPHWAPTNSPELFEKTGAFCRIDVGIDPYEPPGKFQKNCRGGRGFPPFGSYEFSVDFRKNRIFCGRTEASAPTVLLESFGKFVGVDAHIDPREVTNSPRISVKSGLFAGTMWASSPTQIAAFALKNPSVSIKRAEIVRFPRVCFIVLFRGRRRRPRRGRYGSR